MRHTVHLRNVPINLSAIARETGIDHSHLSRIFAGTRRVHSDSLELIAEALGMETGDFLKALNERLKFIGNPRPQRVLIQHPDTVTEV